MMRDLTPQQREKPTEFYLESVVTLGVLEVRLQAARQRQQSIQVTLRPSTKLRNGLMPLTRRSIVTTPCSWR